MLGQAGLDLPQLDAEAADLHLEVVAPQKLDVAVGKIPAQIPRPVHPRPNFSCKRIRNELLRGQLRPVQVPPRYSRPADVQLPHHPLRHRLPLPVQNVDPRVRYRSTDRNSSRVVKHGCNFVGCRKSCGFRRSITVEQVLRKIAAQHSGHYPGIQRIASARAATWAAIWDCSRDAETRDRANRRCTSAKKVTRICEPCWCKERNTS